MMKEKLGNDPYFGNDMLIHPERVRTGLSVTLIRRLVLLVWLLSAFTPSKAQTARITYFADNKSLGVILEELSEGYNLRFAFDADAFSRIYISVNARDKSPDELLEMIAEKGRISFRYVDGTWIAVRLPEKPLPQPVQQVAEVKKKATVMVSGYVYDVNSGNPLLYCNIITPQNRGSITNHSGYFQIEASGFPFEFYISHLGYQRIDTVIASLPERPLQIKLKPFTIVMDEVSVTRREKSMLELGEYSEKVGFNPAQAASVPRLVNDDLVNMLSLIPGVSFINGEGGGISVRGGNPSENLVMLDGMSLLGTGHLLGNISILNANFIRQAFVSRGGFDASYGDRISGIIELNGKSGPLTHPSADASVNLLNGNLLFSVPVAGRLTLSGAWRKSLIDRWQNHLSSRLLTESRISSAGDLDVELTPFVQFEDINLKASVYPAENHLITLNFIDGRDIQVLDYGIGEKQLIYNNELASASNRGYSATWGVQDSRWNHFFSIGHSMLYLKQELESGRKFATVPGSVKPRNPKANPKEWADNRDKYELDKDSNSVYEFRSEWKTEIIHGNLTHQAGVGYVENYFDYSYIAERTQGNTPVDSLSRTMLRRIGHVYLQQLWEPVPFLKIRAGIRINRDFTYRKFHWQPRGGVELKPVQGVRLYYHTGMYNQFLSQIPKIDMNGNVDMVWFLPDSSGYGALKAVHHILGFQYNPKGLLINAELYARNSTGNLRLFAENYRKGPLNSIRYTTQEGEKHSKGLDLFMQYRHSRFTHQLSWSLAEARERIEGFNNNLSFPSLNEHRHRLMLTEVFSYKGWVLSASWIYRSGQPDIFIGDSGNIEYGKTTFFSQFDAGILKTIRFSKISVTGGGSLLNIFNRTNVVEVNAMNISTESSTINLQTSISSLPFTPVFFIRFQYL
jgi:ferric enterobactin receptor